MSIKQWLVTLITLSLLTGCGVTSNIHDEVVEKSKDDHSTGLFLVTNYLNKPLSGFYVDITAITVTNMSGASGLCAYDSTLVSNNALYPVTIYDVGGTVLYNQSITVNVCGTVPIRVDYNAI